MSPKEEEEDLEKCSSQKMSNDVIKDDNDGENDDDDQATTANSTTKSKQQTQQPKKSRASLLCSANVCRTSNHDREEEEEESTEEANDPKSFCQRSGVCMRRLLMFYDQYEFLILVVIAIGLAKAYPPLGAEYVQPQITSTWIAVIFIFFLAGLGLRTEEFKKALWRWKFNLVVQLFNFFVDSSVVFGVSRALLRAGALSEPLSNGLVVCASLSMTINMVLVLSKSAGGDEASAIFNAAAGNMIGVVLSPLLILGYLNVTGTVNTAEVFYELALRVVLPIAIGQSVRWGFPAIVKWYSKHNATFKKLQLWALVFIVYTVFCRTFSADNSDIVSGKDIVITIAIVFCSLVALMVLAWYTLQVLFRNEPTLRVMGLFGCTHKTIAIGVPLINAIYENDDTVGLITLPLLIWHTTQLILGSFVAPKLAIWVQQEQERLGIKAEDDGNEDHKNNNIIVLENDEQEIADEEPKLDVTHVDASRTSTLREPTL